MVPAFALMAGQQGYTAENENGQTANQSNSSTNSPGECPYFPAICSYL
jgi:hypothetical protein